MAKPAITLSSVFNEVAALTAGFYGLMSGLKLGMTSTTILLTAAGLGIGAGLVPVVLGLLFTAATGALGGTIGYKGAKALVGVRPAPVNYNRLADAILRSNPEMARLTRSHRIC